MGDSTELLPCPFCAAPGRFVWSPEPATTGKVKCTRPSCGASSGAFDHSANAIAAWNTRIAGQAELRAQALEEAAQIADKWRDENKAAAAKAKTREGRLSALGLDHPGMAEMLDGAAIECNAIASAIRDLAALQPLSQAGEDA